MSRKLIAGNWKMNCLKGSGIALTRSILEGVQAGVVPAGDTPGGVACDLLLCPPATLLYPIAEIIARNGIALGGQDCHARPSGAHTGDVSAEMLADLGCSHVIVGHSERRQFHGETDEMVRAKAEAAHRAGLTAIICIGETLADRDAGRTLEVVRGHLLGSLPAGAHAGNTVIAYEPLWAIGTGLTPSLEDVAVVHAMIRQGMDGVVAQSPQTRILYGGSVRPDNAAALLRVPHVDGALIGGASLAAADFLAIAAHAA